MVPELPGPDAKATVYVPLQVPSIVVDPEEVEGEVLDPPQPS
jgi:hypothetical protein